MANMAQICLFSATIPDEMFGLTDKILNKPLKILVKEEESLADALTGGIGLDNKYTFQLTKQLVDDIVLVNEKEIADGIHHAYWHESQIVEGAGAVAIASLLNNKFSPKGPSLALLCGRNINIEKHFSLISARK